MDRKMLDEFISKCPRDIKSKIKTIQLAPGEELIKSGGKCDYVYILEKGRVKVYDFTESGELFISYIGPKNRYIFGEIEAIMGTAVDNVRNVHAETSCTFLRFNRADFLQWLKLDFDFNLFVMGALCKSLVDYAQFSMTISSMPLKSRVAIIINDNMDKNGELIISKDTLAGILTTSIRSINRILRELIDIGAITTSASKIKVIDKEYIKFLTISKSKS